MALFGGKEKKQEAKEAREQVMQILARHEYLAVLVEDLLAKTGKISYGDVNGEKKIQGDNDEKWLTECQSYYDSRKRIVTVEADLFEIKWSDTHNEKRQGGDGRTYFEAVEEVYKRISYKYTNNGYKPLSSARYGDTALDLDTVLSCWASVIKEKMQGAFPELEFMRVINGQNVVTGEPTATFTYMVPELEWKDWF